MMKILSKPKDALELFKKDSKEVVTDTNKLVFVDLNIDMFKDNNYIQSKYFRNENGNSCYFANLLKLKDLSLYEMKKVLKQDFGKDVSLKGYRYDPKHYVYSTYLDQMEYEEEDWFREKSLEDENLEKEAERKLRIEPLDFDLVDRLYTLLIKSIKSRRLMLFNLESVPGIINNALDCYYKGVSCGASNAAMSAKLEELQAFLDNPEVREWLKSNPTDMSFDKFDYVDTYQRVLRQITDIRDESLEYCRDLLNNPEDLYIEEIIANDYPECEAVYENCISYNSETGEYSFSEIDDEEYYLD